MARKLVVHIGLEKTGTTSLQHFCHRERRALLRHGLLYPRRCIGRGKSHSPLVASYISHRPEGPYVAMRWVERDRAVRLLGAEIEASRAETALISSEHFATHFDRSEARQLAADFARFDMLIVVTLRDPHSRFLSAYNTHVTAGGRLSVEDFARSMLVPGTRFMSAYETVRIWQDAFGAERIRIVDYDAESDVSAAILRHCGVSMPLATKERPRQRVSLGVDAIEALRCANAAIVARQTVPADSSVAAWVQLSVISILCRRRIVRLRSGVARAWTLSPRTMAALGTIAAADARWIWDTYKIALRGSSARDHIVTDATAHPIPAGQALLAEALVASAVLGLWRPCQALVTLWSRVATARTRTTPAAERDGV